MSCRSLSTNAITSIPADAFTNLTQLQTLFVLVVSMMAVCVVAADAESIVTDVLQGGVQQLHHNDSSQCVHQSDTASDSVCFV
jgi:hypothetical protein